MNGIFEPISPTAGVHFHEDLIRRYDVPGPRYTSYPTAALFREDFGPGSYRQSATESGGAPGRGPLSLYFHLPFCARVCYYCACNKIITANRSRADHYVDYLVRELRMHADLFGGDREVQQLHWGGGTPTFLSPDLMKRLMVETRQAFPFADDDTGEYSIEIDPREAGADTVELLRELGFNRMSIGIQDFDSKVQAAVNRPQTFDETAAVIAAARDQGYRSVSVDLIYGLPLQSEASFARTLDRVLALEPDRLVVFNYAHLPAMFKTQRQIDAEQLPAAEVKLAILGHTVDRLTRAGYEYIGMDHFARPDDELAEAQRNGALQRNFQGYSTHGDCELIGMGITAISMMEGSYCQNVRTVDAYCTRVDAGEIPVFRGLRLTAEDRLRRRVIMSLICNFRLKYADVENAYGINFQEHFSDELDRLRTMEEDGLVDLDSNGIAVTPAGRLLIRNICMVFDAYLKPDGQAGYSRTV